MKTLFITLAAILVISFAARSQSFLNHTKEQVKRHILHDKKVKLDVIEADTAITFRLNDPKYKKSTKVFHFNKEGKCDSEALFEDCEECYQYELNELIKHTKWVKTDSTHYVTQRGKKLEIVTHYQGQPFAFVVRPRVM